MDNSEFYDYEDRRYIQPTLSRDEQLSFISTLRDTMGRNNAQINTQTRNLGTDVPSNLGGLTGSNSYFTQRYQTIPVENTVNTLKATAQAKALNDLMSNYEAQMKNRANQAYRRAARTASSSGGGGEDEEGETLEIVTNTNAGGNDTTTVNTTDWSSALGKLNSTPEGRLYYLDASPSKQKTPIYLENLTSADDLRGTVRLLGSGYNGQRKFLNGVQYIYLDTGQFAPSWYRVGAE